MRVEEDTVPSINNPEYDKAVLRNKPEILTINEPVDYMARAVRILMRGKDITRAIGRVGP